MNERFKDMLHVSRVYKKGERVFFDTCTYDNSRTSCRECDNNACNLQGKEKTGGRIYSLLKDDTEARVEIGGMRHNARNAVRERLKEVGDLYTVPREWLNRSRYQTEEEEKLANKFIW